MQKVGTPDLSRYVKTGKKGGFGLYLINKTMDEVRYVREGDVNVLALIKRFPVEIPPPPGRRHGRGAGADHRQEPPPPLLRAGEHHALPSVVLVASLSWAAPWGSPSARC